jgi:hypothetical protein
MQAINWQLKHVETFRALKARNRLNLRRDTRLKAENAEHGLPWAFDCLLCSTARSSTNLYQSVKACEDVVPWWNMGTVVLLNSVLMNFKSLTLGCLRNESKDRDDRAASNTARKILTRISRIEPVEPVEPVELRSARCRKSEWPSHTQWDNGSERKGQKGWFLGDLAT